MKIGILSRNPRLYSTNRMVEAAKERGHEVLRRPVEGSVDDLGEDVTLGVRFGHQRAIEEAFALLLPS